MIVNMPPAVPFVKAGKLRALAVTTKNRSPLLPDVPTVAESGLPGFETVAWFGILAPAATPRDIVNRLSEEIAKIARSPAMRERLTALGAEAVGGTRRSLPPSSPATSRSGRRLPIGRHQSIDAQDASRRPMTALFDNFVSRRVPTSGAEIHLVLGGSGPPLLLLHGYPQTHAMWHRVAPRSRDRLRWFVRPPCYGDSEKPESGPSHVNYSKRAMAQDQVEAMESLGFSQFTVAGHDRGARVAHRMAMDHPDKVKRLAVLDIRRRGPCTRRPTRLSRRPTTTGSS